MDVISDKRAGEIIDKIEEAPNWLIGGAMTLAFSAAAAGTGFVAAHTFPHPGAIIPGLASVFTGVVAASIPIGSAYEFIKQKFGNEPKP